MFWEQTIALKRMKMRMIKFCVRRAGRDERWDLVDNANCPSTHEAGAKPRGERSSRQSQPGDPNVSEQPSPGACVLSGMLGGGGGVPKKWERWREVLHSYAWQSIRQCQDLLQRDRQKGASEGRRELDEERSGWMGGEKHNETCI